MVMLRFFLTLLPGKAAGGTWRILSFPLAGTKLDKD